ncbi:hypothetical protein pb186bvf_008601 [Paramecium bursaria]
MLNLKSYIHALNNALLEGSDNQTDLEIMLQQVMAELHKVQQQIVPFQNHMKHLIQTEIIYVQNMIIMQVKTRAKIISQTQQQKQKISVERSSLYAKNIRVRILLIRDKIKDAIISTEKVLDELENLFKNQPQFEENYFELNEGSLSNLIDQIKMERYFTQKSINSQNTWIIEYNDNIMALQRQLNIIMKLLDRQNVKQFEPIKMINLKVALIDQKQEKEVCINCNIF